MWGKTDTQERVSKNVITAPTAVMKYEVIGFFFLFSFFFD